MSKTPRKTSKGKFRWYTEQSAMPSSFDHAKLPVAVFALLTGGKLIAHGLLRIEHRYRDYDSHAEAMADALQAFLKNKT